MKKKTLSTVLAASLLATLAAAFVYAAHPATISAKVPFAFSVGGKSFPEGDYVLRQHTDGVIEIVGPNGKNYVSRTFPGKSEVREGVVKIVFHRYDDVYFISEVFDGTARTGLKFPVSRQEKEKIAALSNSTPGDPERSEVAVLATR